MLCTQATTERWADGVDHSLVFESRATRRPRVDVGCGQLEDRADLPALSGLIPRSHAATHQYLAYGLAINAEALADALQ